MASLPFVPGTPQAAGPPDLSALIGASPEQAPQQSPTGPQQDMAKAVMYQFHDLTASLEGLARQFPMVSEQLAAAKEILMDAMVKVVGSQSGGTEAPGPQVIG